jgi:hypothetical protein
MWRIFSVASLVVATGMVMWPARATRQTSSAASPVQEKCHLIEVMHYGGNLICHERFENNVLGSGNNVIGRSRVEAVTREHCVSRK